MRVLPLLALVTAALAEIRVAPKSDLMAPNWLGFHKIQLDEAAEWKRRGDLDLLFVGDTDVETMRGTEGGVQPCVRCNGAQALFQHTYGHLHFAAFGMAKDRSENTLWRLRNGELPKGLAVKVVVVITGPMDLTHLPRLTAAEQAAQIKALVAHVREASPAATVVPVSLLPRGRLLHHEQVTTHWLRTNITAVNDLLANDAQWAEDLQVKFVDCHDDFVDSTKAFVKREMMPDFMFLTEPGLRQITRCLAPTLDALLPKTNDEL